MSRGLGDPDVYGYPYEHEATCNINVKGGSGKDCNCNYKEAKVTKLNNNGFTVVEVLITLAVLVCIIAIGVFGISAVVDHNNKWNAERGRGDAPVGRVDAKPRDVYQMPDRFSNIAEVCDKYGNAIVMATTDNGKAIWAIKDGCE